MNGILLYRRKVYFSLVYLASIMLYTHLFAGITWTAHLVTLLFCLIPFLLIDTKSLNRGARISWYFIIGLLVFLGIEGSDTVGEWLYLAIRWYDVFTYLLLGLFLYYSWVVWSRKFPGPNPLLIEKDFS
jgi:hypothetical protein